MPRGLRHSHGEAPSKRLQQAQVNDPAIAY